MVKFGFSPNAEVLGVSSRRAVIYAHYKTKTMYINLRNLMAKNQVTWIIIIF